MRAGVWALADRLGNRVKRIVFQLVGRVIVEAVDLRTPVAPDRILEINRMVEEPIRGHEAPTIYVPPKLTGRNIVLRRYASARLFGRSGVAFSRNGELISETVFRTSERIPATVASLTALQLARASIPFDLRPTRLLKGQFVLLDSLWDSFGHWVPEHFLRIRHLLLAGVDISGITFLIRPRDRNIKLHLMELAGVRAENILTLGEEDQFLLEELLVTSYPEISPQALAWVAALFPEQTDRKLKSKARLYLSRNGLESSASRMIANESTVLPVLESFGFEVYHPQDFSIQEQVNRFRSAEVLFGPQGSAFTGMIFMRPGSILIEAYSAHKVHLFNRQMALTLGHRHFPVFDPHGVGLLSNTKHPKTARLRQQVELDASRLSQILTEALN